MARKNRNTTLDEDLYKEIQILAVINNKNANDLIEEGMKYVLEKYKNCNTHLNVGGDDNE